ncbi:MAG TPA: endolytic transglycosylase MltG, partial [Candidatus Bathyarchaeia archaeon]|nr:endolytic transglycosylase MltG [Candidatus Bathyarchaeia archaeon]
VLLAESPLSEGYTPLQVVTVASLIEEEARGAEERPDVAAVIYNRLKRGMPLQLDSTIQYALNKYGQRLLYSDREVDSPYNTYKNKGLPPGPISNPGVASLRAALQPSQADYIYFVSNADGLTHTFSSSNAEHIRAVQRFRREIAPQRKALREKEQAGQ